MIPISIFLALASTMPLTGSATGTAQTATDTIVCPADSIPVKIMAKAVSDNSLSPVFTLDEVTALPSPDVAAMTRHIDEGIDYSTGTGGLSIPLYSWSAGDLKMSLGLRYRLGAYKVKERAGWVGLGWNLTGGGCVTREIVGLPDEKANQPFRDANQIRAGENGHLHLQDIEEYRADSGLDRYRYSCPGAEGSFVIKSGKIVQTPETDNIIEFTGTERDGVKDFVVTTPDGTKYYFTEREKLAFRVVPSIFTTPIFILNYQDAVSAWHLSKIESPGGADVAIYSYTTLREWQRGETIGGESVRVTWSDSGLSDYPQMHSSNTTTPRNHTQTTFSGQKLLRGITTRTAVIDFNTKTDNAYYENDTPGMLTRIRVLNPNGECVREISLDMACHAQSPRMLAGVKVQSMGALIDSHEFSYIGDYTGGYDFFGYRNASSSELRTIIDTQTGKMNPEIVSDSVRMKSRAMSCHKTGMGLTTHYEYEPSSVTQSGNGKTYTFPVGLRIKTITSSDAVTGRTRTREFTYGSPVCDVDFTELDAGCFTGLSGDYTNVLIQNTFMILKYYYTCLTFLTSSKLKGFQPENATVYYGIVEENESGTDIAVPIKTRYEYDVARCKRTFVPAYPARLPSRDVRNLTYGLLPENMWTACPSFRDGMQTGARLHGSFMEGSGFEPRLIKKIAYKHYGNAYYPDVTEKYHYITVDSASLITGIYHESAVRSIVDVGNVRHKDYTSSQQFTYGNCMMSCSGSLLDSVSTTKHFNNGATRVSTTRYLYSGTKRMPGTPVNKDYPVIVSPDTVLADFITPDMLNVFGVDSLSVSSGARTCYGIRRRGGGHVMEHYTAISGMFSTLFFSKVKDAQQKMLPVREIWVVDGTDTITRTWEYELFNGAYRPTLIRLAGKDDTEMDFQRITGYTKYGHPTSVLRKGKPEMSYKWGYGGDLLTESTENGGGISLSTTYTHTPLVGCTSKTTPDGSVTRYTYGGMGLSSVTNGAGHVLTRYSYSLFGEGESKLNTVVEESLVSHTGSKSYAGVPGMTTTVYDGFGIPVALSRENFGSDGDVAEITEYDGLHRPVRKWRPLPVSDLSEVLSSTDLLSSVSSGLYDGDVQAFSKLKYPESKEERPISETIPGDSFKNHPARSVFTCSSTAAGKYRVQRFSLQGSTVKSNGYYGLGELDCEVHIDGNGDEILIFTDVLGRTVLERRSATGGKYADTYTISDSWGNPLVVLPPMASSLMGSVSDSWKLTASPVRDYAFVYTYDNALRVRSRIDGGVRKTEFAYDSDGRLAFSKESGKNVRFHTYDHLGREAVTGTCAPEGKEQLWTSDMSGETPPMTMTLTGKKGTGFLGTGYMGSCIEPHSSDSLLYANYYDDYSFKPASWKPIDADPPTNAEASPKGLLTGRLLSTLTSEGRWNSLTLIYYQSGGIPIRTESNGPLDYCSENIIPSVGGLPLTVVKTAKMRGKEYKYTVNNNYDPYGRLVEATLIGDGIPAEGKLLTEVSFDAVGNPSGFKSEGNYTRSVTRDIRGRVSSWSCPFISQELGYGDSGTNSDWTGRITWRNTTAESIDRRYDYVYSPEGFLTSAVYSSRSRPGDNFSATYSYDLNGNVLRASRKSPDPVGRSAAVSETVAAYNGNRLARITGEDDASAPSESRMRKNGVNSPAVGYDDNGNLDLDAYRGIERIIYNDIGRPELIETAEGDQVHVSYLADGRKFMELYLSGNDMWGKERSLVNGFEFSEGKFVRFETPFGYIDGSNALHTYIPDYQGNIVGVFNTSKGTLEQFTDYYPYGMPHMDATGAEKNRRKFVAKELTTEFGVDMYDFEERYFNPFIPSFQSPDPLAYKTPHVSPYSYCHGDPVNYSDPTGLFRSKEEARMNEGIFDESAEIIFDPERGEWYIALDWTGTRPYPGKGSMTKHYGDDKNLVDALDKAAPALLTGTSVCFGVQDNLFNKVARETLDAATNSTLKDTQAVTKALGKEVGAYYKGMKLVGKGAAFVGIGIASYDMATYGMSGGRNPLVYIKYGCDMAVSVIGSTWIGMGLSVIYMYADYATEGFYIDYSITDKKVKK